MSINWAQAKQQKALFCHCQRHDWKSCRCCWTFGQAGVDRPQEDKERLPPFATAAAKLAPEGRRQKGYQPSWQSWLDSWTARKEERPRREARHDSWTARKEKRSCGWTFWPNQRGQAAGRKLPPSPQLRRDNWTAGTVWPFRPGKAAGRKATILRHSRGVTAEQQERKRDHQENYHPSPQPRRDSWTTRKEERPPSGHFGQTGPDRRQEGHRDSSYGAIKQAQLCDLGAPANAKAGVGGYTDR